MTPAARLAAAIGVLDAWESGLRESGTTLATQLAQWARNNRYAGARDRAAIGDLVHDAIRRRRSLAALAGAAGPVLNPGADPDSGPDSGGSGSTGRRLILMQCVTGGTSPDAIAALFSGEGHAPPALSAAERQRLDTLADGAARAAILAGLPAATRSDWPDWLWDALAESTDAPEAEAQALAARGAFDLRVNRLRADPETAARALAEDGLEAGPAPLSPIGLRVANHRRLGRSRAFLEGLVEPQDAASQACALLAAHAASDSGVDGPVVDFCAGGGGKTLALAAETAEGGPLEGRRLIAHDIDARRLAPLPERLARAGAAASALGTAALRAEAETAALVLVDAPCSGSGAWARETEAKWRLTPERLDRYGALQRDALSAGAALVRPGGTLAYVTCSVLRRENDSVADWFEAERPDFAPLALAPSWGRAGLTGAAPAPGVARRQFWPARDAVGGFFIALWRRKPAS